MDKEKNQTATEPAGIERYKEVAEFVSIAFKWAMLLPGGICLLIYSMYLGHFPEGIELGEGLAFYLLCAAFWLVYVLYAAVAATMGAVAMAPIAILGQHFQRKRAPKDRRSGQHSSPQVDYKAMYDSALWVPATLGYVVLLAYATHDWQNALQFFGMALLQGLVLALLIQVRTRIRSRSSGLLLTQQTDEEQRNSMSQLRSVRAALILVLFVVPLMFGPNKVSLVNAAFQAAQLRKENATIHVKKPWSERVARSQLKTAKSFLGDEYVEFRQVNVLLRSVGTVVILELPAVGSTQPVKLPVPAEAVYVE